MDKKTMKSAMLLIAFAIFLVLFVVNFGRVLDLLGHLATLLEPVFLGFAIAFVLNRPCKFFDRHYRRLLQRTPLVKAARPLAVVSAYLAFALVAAGIVSLVVPQVEASIRTLIGNMNVYLGNFQQLFNRVVDYLDLTALENVDFTDLGGTLRELLNGLLLTAGDAISSVAEATGTVINWAVNFIMGIIFSIYMLGGSEKLTGQCRRLVRAYLPEKAADRLISVVRLTAETFTNFVAGQLLEACILGLLCLAGMLILGFHYADLISVIVGVTALVPIVGAYVGAFLGAFLLLIVDPLEALWFLIFLVVLQQIEGNLIYPRVAGTIIGLPGLWVLTAITVGGGLFGLAGMLIGVPAAAVCYALLRQDLLRREKEKGLERAEEESGN